MVRLFPFALAIAVSAVLAPVASASTVGVESGVIVYRAAAGESNSVSVDPGPSAGKVEITDSGFPGSITPGSGCTAGVFESEAVCQVGAGGIRIELGNEGDSLHVNDDLGSFPISADLGDELDTYVGPSSGTTPPTVQGGTGNDDLVGGALADVLHGGPGNDTLNGRGGADKVYGDDGDDSMNGDANGPAAADVIDGGGGYDYITDEWGEDAASPAAIDVSVDGAANDGRAGERDNVVGVERIWVANPGRVAGSSGPDDIYVYPASGSSTVLGMAGNDMVKGGDSAETVDGGSGADKVVGGRGDDVVVGGPGPDTLYGDNDAGGCGPIICAIQIGNDTIRARDGERDSIDCGVGSDTAVVDAVDVVANCEQVDRGAAGGGGGGAGGGGGGGGRLALTLPKKPSLRSLAGGGVRIGVACTARCSVKLKVTAAKALARKLRAGKSRVVATGSGKRSSAGKLNVRLTVPSKLRARLRRLGSARLTLEVAVTQGGSKSVVKKALKLKR